MAILIVSGSFSFVREVGIILVVWVRKDTIKSWSVNPKEEPALEYSSGVLSNK